MGIRFSVLTSLILGVVLLLAVNIFSTSTLSSARLDLTENKLFTLSDGTKKILSALDERVTLRLYLSENVITQLPNLNSYAIRVKDLLEEYTRIANGKLDVHLINPEPFSIEEDRAVGHGLRGVPLGDGNEVLYFGLVGSNSTSDEQVIPYLSGNREEFLEYDLTQLIHTLASPNQKVVGLISMLPIDGMGPRAELRGLSAPPWVVMEQVRGLFDVRNLDHNVAKVPDDIDLLMVVHPKELGAPTLYAIDQFVMKGGRALVFIDPHSESDQAQRPGAMGMSMPASRTSNPEALLKSWGIDFDPRKIAGEMESAARVRTQQKGRVITIDYPVWMNLQGESLNQSDTVTAQLGNITIATSGVLEPRADATTTISPLIQTGAAPSYFAAETLVTFGDPQELLRAYKSEGRKFTLAARVTGKAKSAFADGAPAVEPKEGEDNAPLPPNEPHIPDSDNINLIVVADTDILSDRFWVQVQEFLGNRITMPTAANGSFVINAIDNLLGSEELISVRNRGSSLRPFERVVALRQDAEKRFREKEEELVARLQQAESELLQLEQAKSEDEGVLLSAAQQQEITKFRKEKVRIRKELRDVRHGLRKDIESLETKLKFINIGFVPILIGVVGLVAGLMRASRRSAKAA